MLVKVFSMLLTLTVFGLNCVTEKPRLTPLARVPVGVVQALLTEAADVVAGFRIRSVDVVVALARFAEVAGYLGLPIVT